MAGRTRGSRIAARAAAPWQLPRIRPGPAWIWRVGTVRRAATAWTSSPPTSFAFSMLSVSRARWSSVIPSGSFVARQVAATYPERVERSVADRHRVLRVEPRDQRSAGVDHANCPILCHAILPVTSRRARPTFLSRKRSSIGSCRKASSCRHISGARSSTSCLPTIPSQRCHTSPPRRC